MLRNSLSTLVCIFKMAIFSVKLIEKILKRNERYMKTHNIILVLNIFFIPRQNLLWFYFCSFQSLSCVPLFATPWTAACQASLSITNSRSLLKLMSIESVMLILLQLKLIKMYLKSSLDQEKLLNMAVSTENEINKWRIIFGKYHWWVCLH